RRHARNLHSYPRKSRKTLRLLLSLRRQRTKLITERAIAYAGPTRLVQCATWDEWTTRSRSKDTAWSWAKWKACFGRRPEWTRLWRLVGQSPSAELGELRPL